MNLYYLNRQNKKHAELFKQDRQLNRYDLAWCEFAVMGRADNMNKRLAKLSPRRHKQARDRLLKELYDDEVTTSSSFQDFIEALSEQDS